MTQSARPSETSATGRIRQHAMRRRKPNRPAHGEAPVSFRHTTQECGSATSRQQWRRQEKSSTTSTVSPTTSRPPTSSSGSCSNRSKPTTHRPCASCSSSGGETGIVYGARPSSARPTCTATSEVFRPPESTRVAVGEPPGGTTSTTSSKTTTPCRPQAVEALRNTVRDFLKDADPSRTSPYPTTEDTPKT